MSDRYAKQRIFLGPEADARLREKRVVLLGVGALGSVLAPWMVRAGIGHLTIIDRDLVDLSNLQRQCLYQEQDVMRPKAHVAVERLKLANSSVDLKSVVADVTSGNARELLSGYDLILDGTDNFEARFLINDVSILTGAPWIYAGAIGGEAVVWPLNPPKTPCLRCIMEEPPVSGDVDTCDTAGVLGPTVGVAGSWAALEALKLLTGQTPHADLVRFDLWRDERQFINPPQSRCRFCTNKITEFLDARWSIRASRLCGLDGVQIRVNPPGELDLAAIQTRLEARTGRPWKFTGLTLGGQDGDWRVVLFRDGRALIHGDVETDRAKSWYSDVVGY